MSQPQRTAPADRGYSHWFLWVVAVFITCLITANITAVKLVSVLGLILPAGRQLDLDELLLLSYLREHSEIDVVGAAAFLQRPERDTRDVLERLALQPAAWLERRGKRKGVTYHLARGPAVELLGKAVYTRARDIDAVRWPELIRSYIEQHGSINNAECRELLGLGSSRSAQTRATRILGSLSFLEPYGTSRKTMRYRLCEGRGIDNGMKNIQHVV